MSFNKFQFISILLLILGLNWAGLLAIGQTLASFNDTEISFGNMLTASSLDFQLDSPQDFFPPSPGESNKLVREIKIINQGNLNFKYQIRIGDYSGKLCENLKLSANLNGGEVECSTSSLTGFSCGPFEISNDIENWQFVASFSGEKSKEKFLPQSCRFSLIFEGWQSDFPAFSGGFSDQEEIKNKITKHYSEVLPEPSIVINEFLPNPVGPDHAEKPNGEWVELYNKGEVPVHLKDWFLMDLQRKELPIPDSTIPPKGFLVVYLNGKHSPGWLNNKGEDVVSLWAPKNSKISLKKRCLNSYCLIDAHAYRGKVPEGKSFARIPDGSKNWYDPIPTPGGPNQLSEEEKKSLQPEPEVIELSQEQLFQMFIDQLSEESTSETNEKFSLEKPSFRNESMNEDISTSTEIFIQESNSTDSATTSLEISSPEESFTNTTSTEATSTEATSTENMTFEETSFVSEISNLEISNQTTTEVSETSTNSETSTSDEISINEINVNEMDIKETTTTETTTTKGTTTELTIQTIDSQSTTTETTNTNITDITEVTTTETTSSKPAINEEMLNSKEATNSQETTTTEIISSETDTETNENITASEESSNKDTSNTDTGIETNTNTNTNTGSDINMDTPNPEANVDTSEVKPSSNNESDGTNNDTSNNEEESVDSSLDSGNSSEGE